MPKTDSPQVLRLLSYNIQVGIQTRHFADYIMASWQHLLPNQKRLENLHKISQLLKPYDLVALQEVDGGSLRSSYINQVEYLANYSAFPYWYHQCNRDLGKIAQHSNGLLSKIPVQKIINHKLPGLIPGRGAIEAIIGESEEKLIIIVAHLSLSKRARNQQVKYLAAVIEDSPNVIIMGDLNCDSEQLLEQFALNGIELKSTEDDSTDNKNSATFPSWQPSRQYDHILVSQSIKIVSQSVLPNPISDHLPVALEVLLPGSILSTETNINHYHPVRISNELLHN
ncbi:MAG: endonuclease/exonuclease/phosphatase family metal-dependent hydrolase [Enterobacterales bacterium]|jgi:endonuclease/exonuclease/phosphatase family metal-dependent hydrolase